MPRVHRGTRGAEKRKKILSMAKGFRGKGSTCKRIANQAVMKALVHSYNDRRRRKGDFRELWIMRIGAAAQQNGTSYSRMINGLQRCGVLLNRKMLADIAVRDKETFACIAEMATQERTDA
ncbi:50S ribosomal protein L20 [Candidatus Acetothermia bacterium]|jgi:large subunit ribosomal protein L20|nr:50S ribosomal protein L20 [Candidatus Acetothermia bacterium]MCI2426471.1 50S ribosomal protein L20 [Candidatus Acetothermia bacterium]MCI2427200.1 50S ribosomal protein L20 [Candidatus Acetothermia bacterium]MCI2428588.1 50S ribosomal protein L20 [Candidatus Acetothermia bacterium]